MRGWKIFLQGSFFLDLIQFLFWITLPPYNTRLIRRRLPRPIYLCVILVNLIFELIIICKFAKLYTRKRSEVGLTSKVRH